MDRQVYAFCDYVDLGKLNSVLASGINSKTLPFRVLSPLVSGNHHAGVLQTDLRTLRKARDRGRFDLGKIEAYKQGKEIFPIGKLTEDGQSYLFVPLRFEAFLDGAFNEREIASAPRETDNGIIDIINAYQSHPVLEVGLPLFYAEPRVVRALRLELD